VQRAIILYDADCGFCLWSLQKILAWDRHNRLRPVALQDPEAARLLPGMEERQRMRSWHLVTEDGTVYSSGAAVAPLMRLLPGGTPFAAVASAFPRSTESLYRWVARNRGTLGRVLRAGRDPSMRGRRSASSRSRRSSR
jgi:predicted DCC family thiol-disulfide oxidoreductase YuxK